MYTVINLYRIKQIHAQEFIDLNEKASEIYLSHGALENNMYHAIDMDDKNGFKDLIDIMKVRRFEVLFFGQSVFRNKSHYKEVMKDVHNDTNISQLVEDMSKIVDLSKVITGTFTTEN